MNRKYTTKEEAREQHLKQMREWYHRNKPTSPIVLDAQKQSKRVYYQENKQQYIQRAMAWQKKKREC